MVSEKRAKRKAQSNTVSSRLRSPMSQSQRCPAASTARTGHTLEDHLMPRAAVRRPATDTESGIEPVGAAFHHAPKHWNKCDEEWSNCCSCRATPEPEGCSLTEICTGMQFHQSIQRRCILSPDHKARPHGKQSYKSRLRFHYTQSQLARVFRDAYIPVEHRLRYKSIHSIRLNLWTLTRVIWHLTRPPLLRRRRMPVKTTITKYSIDSQRK